MPMLSFSRIALLCAVVTAVAGCQTTTSFSKLGEKDPAKAAQLRTQLAAELIRKGEYDRAKNELDQALRANSRSSEAYAMMGVLLQQVGTPENLRQAEENFRRAISLDGDNAQARNNYGTYLFVQKRYQDAAEQFKIAGSTLGYEQRYTALENLGRTYLKLNNQAEAEQAFKQALQANRDSVIAKLELTEIFYNQGKYALASQAYEAFLRDTGGMERQDARVLWLGVRLAHINHDSMQEQIFANQLKAQFPDSPEYQKYLKLKNSTEAVWK